MGIDWFVVPPTGIIRNENNSLERYSTYTHSFWVRHGIHGKLLKIPAGWRINHILVLYQFNNPIRYFTKYRLSKNDETAYIKWAIEYRQDLMNIYYDSPTEVLADVLPLAGYTKWFAQILNFRLTINESTKMLALQKFSLPHESCKRCCPTFRKNLHPLRIQLEKQKSKQTEHESLVQYYVRWRRMT